LVVERTAFYRGNRLQCRHDVYGNAYPGWLTFVLSAVRCLDRSASSNTTYLMNSPQSTKNDAWPTRNPCVNDHRDEVRITDGVGVGVARISVDAVAMIRCGG
jgi:hypothetical protein